MHEITRRLEIDYGHRLLRHRGKCANYHGHRGVVLVSARVKQATPKQLTLPAPPLPNTDGYFAVPEVLPIDGMVIDFSIVKEVLGGWLDQYWDHGMLLERGDPMVEMLIREAMLKSGCAESAAAQLAATAAPSAVLGSSPKFFVTEKPPTAENLSEKLFEVSKLLFEEHPIEVTRITFYETPNCCAEYPVAPVRIPLLHETVGGSDGQ